MHHTNSLPSQGLDEAVAVVTGYDSCTSRVRAVLLFEVQQVQLIAYLYSFATACPELVGLVCYVYAESYAGVAGVHMMRVL
jgi:hypothetical protein